MTPPVLLSSQVSRHSDFGFFFSRPRRLHYFTSTSQPRGRPSTRSCGQAHTDASWASVSAADPSLDAPAPDASSVDTLCPRDHRPFGLTTLSSGSSNSGCIQPRRLPQREPSHARRVRLRARFSLRKRDRPSSPRAGAQFTGVASVTASRILRRTGG